MTSRQSTHEANLRKAGWRRVGVWLSPDDAKALEQSRMAAEGYLSEQEAIRRAIRSPARIKWVKREPLVID